MFSTHQKKELVILLTELCLLFIDMLLFQWLWFKYYANNLYIPFVVKGHIAVVFVFVFVYGFFAKMYGGFDLKTTRAFLVFYSNVVASVVTGFVMFVIIWLMNRKMPSFPPLILGMVLWSFAAFAWAKPAVMITSKVYPPARTVIIYDNEFAFRKGLSICKQVPRRFNVVDTISANENEVIMVHKLKAAKTEAVMLCGIHSSKRNDILKFCINANIPTYIRPNIGDFLVNSAKSMQLANLPILLSERSAQSPIYSLGKRAFDIVFALFFLVILSPVYLITALSIKGYDKGPVLYSQIRLTKDGREFKIYKFRSMKVDAEKESGARLAAENDSRITPVGKIIRATRIDELPQMINILKGDMSVVGPRPERPELAAEYERTMPEFSLRLQVKAGLTGYAQVHGKYNTSPYDKLQMDLMYIAKQSFATDLMICMETLKVIFMPDSTEGIAEDETTAEDHK